MSDAIPSRAPAFHPLAGLWRSAPVLLSITTLLWAGNFIVGRAVHNTVPPIALAFLRWSIAGSIATMLANRHLRPDIAEMRRHWRVVLILSVTGVAVFNTFVYIGLRSTSAINGLLLQSTLPALIMACSYLVFRERAGWTQFAGITVSFAGVVEVITHGEPESLLHTPLNPGDVWIFIALFFYAAYSVTLRRRPRVHPASLLAVTFLLGAAMLLPFVIWESLSGDRLHADLPTLLAVGYVSVCPSLISYFCFNRAVELIGANRAGHYIHLMPIFGSLLAVLLLGEKFRLFHAIGAVLIFAGIAFATRSPARVAEKT